MYPNSTVNEKRIILQQESAQNIKDVTKKIGNKISFEEEKKLDERMRKSQEDEAVRKIQSLVTNPELRKSEAYKVAEREAEAYAMEELKRMDDEEIAQLRENITSGETGDTAKSVKRLEEITNDVVARNKRLSELKFQRLSEILKRGDILTARDKNRDLKELKLTATNNAISSYMQKGIDIESDEFNTPEQRAKFDKLTTTIYNRLLKDYNKQAYDEMRQRNTPEALERTKAEKTQKLIKQRMSGVRKTGDFVDDDAIKYAQFIEGEPERLQALKVKRDDEKFNAATNIQKIVKGKIAARKFAEQRKQKEDVENMRSRIAPATAATNIQKIVRGRILTKNILGHKVKQAWEERKQLPEPDLMAQEQAEEQDCISFVMMPH